jgi:PAS domain S-box-containing protein
MDKGLPSDMVVQFNQCPNGYIWLATYKGISRFDGVRSTNFNHSNSDAIQSITIQGITQDTLGRIWFCSQKGIAVYKDYSFTKDPNLALLDNENVEAIHFDKVSGNIWIGTNSKGVFRYNYRQLEPMSQFIEITKSIVKTITSDSKGNIWIGTESGNIVKYDGRNFKEIIPTEKINVIGSFYVTLSGKVWVATSEGVYSIVNDKLMKHSEIGVTRSNVIIEDNHNTLWIGTQSGLFRYNLLTSQLDSLNEKSGIPNNLILDILVDNEGNIWGATYRKGIFRLSDGLILNISENEGLSSDVIMGVAQAGKDKFYVADEYGTVNVIEKGEISILKLKTQIPRDRLKYIYIDSKQNFWKSTYSGLLKVDKHGKETLYTPERGFPSLTIRLTYEDNEGNIWVGTRSFGIHRINTNGSISTFDQTNGLSSNYIMSIVQDKLGRIIALTKNGINIIENDRVTKYINTDNGLPSNFAFNIHIDKDNIFWLSTNDGIIRIENDTSIFVYNIQNGLFDNTLFDILEENDEYFWISTDIGIVRASKSELNLYAKGVVKSYSYKVFDRSDGMKNYRCMGAAKSFLASDGRMFFPTNGGVSIIDPKDIKEESFFPRVIIESISVSGTTIPQSAVFKVPPGSSRLQINYTAINLKSPDRIKFRYRLEPFDDQWIEAGQDRVARYTNISPGTYTFSVLSTNPEGTWNTKAEYSVIIVMASWWQTFWFKVLVGIIAVSALFAMYKLRTRSIKKQKIELERLVVERTALIAQQKVEIEQQSMELEKLSIVASHTNNAIVIAEPNGEIIWVNDSFVKFYGYNLENLKAEKGSNLASICEDPNTRSIIKNCIQNHKPISYSIEVSTNYNTKVWIQTTLTPIIGRDGSVRNLVAIDTDITEIKNAEKEMINLNDEIVSQSDAILKQKEEIQNQRDELEQINTLLIKHTENIESSIWYALTIQKAILPDRKIIDRFFENFIVFKPRDIVSGDFYWFTRIFDQNGEVEKLLIAVIDCTGHGVPGALMSMIGSRLLSEVVNERKVHNPANILSQMNKQVNLALKQEVSENIDGMDVAICLIENLKEQKVNVTFSGANRPLYILRSQSPEFEVVKGNRKSIGGMMPDLDAEFMDHQIQIAKGDIVLMNTDGYIDQNGTDGKKLTYIKMHQMVVENRDKSMQEIGEILDIAFDEHRGMNPQRDDATVMGIRF